MSGWAMSVEHVDNIGAHYYQTLISWRENFLANSGEIERLGLDDKFIRKTEYYFSLSAAAFRSRVVDCMEVVLSRPGNVAALGNPSMCFPPNLNNQRAWKRNLSE